MPKYVAALLLLFTPCVLGQEASPKDKPQRIICTWPKGKVLRMVKPTYPSQARKEGIAGPVTVEVGIDKQGVPKSLRVTRGEPVLAEAVLSALWQWRWQPYRLNGKPVETETVVTVNFKPARP